MSLDRRNLFKALAAGAAGSALAVRPARKPNSLRQEPGATDPRGKGRPILETGTSSIQSSPATIRIRPS